MPPRDAATVVRFGVFEFDPNTGDLWKAGRRTRLQEQARVVLARLLACPGDLVTREEVRAALWPSDTFVDVDTALNVIINKIRQTLGDSAAAPRFIETIPRRGYRFIAPVVPAGRLPADPLADDGDRGSRLRRARSVLAAGAAVALLATIAVGWAWRAESAASRAVGVRPHRLAILPLENLSGDAAEDYFVDGIAEALVTDLASIRGLDLISRQSTKRFKGSTEPTAAIAAALGGVDAMIQGSVLRIGDRVRLNVRLIDGHTDRHLWAQAYEYERRDISKLQTEVTQAVAREIRVTLTSPEIARLTRPRPVNPAAHDAYLRGRYLLTGTAESDATIIRALAEFERARALDPQFALAYVGIAEVHQVRATFQGTQDPAVARPLAYSAARRAIELDPELGEAYAVLARVQLSEFDWAGAKQSFARMLELSPGNASGLVWYAYQLLLEGRFDDAVAVARRAEGLDPLDLNTRVRVGFVHSFAHREQDAIDRYRQVLALDATNTMARGFLVSALTQSGRTGEALTEAGGLLGRQGPSPFPVTILAVAYGFEGDRDRCRQFLDELLAASKRQYVSPAHMAYAYLSLDDRDRAFEWLERAYEERSNFMLFFPLHDWGRPTVRDDPRYISLVTRIRQQHAVRGQFDQP